jgi:hypothetical protein
MSPRILERIKGLLRLAQSSNPAEAELAMKKAFELANRHGVEVDDLDLDAELEAILHASHACGERVSYLRMRIFNILMRFFKVEVCLSNPQVIFVGRETDVAIAGYVYDFLVGVLSRLLREFGEAEKKARRVVNANKKKNFIQGFIYGISSKLSESEVQLQIADQQSALVVVEKQARVAYLDELVPNRATKKLTSPKLNRTALMSGFREGEKTTIHQPLNGGARETLALEN